MRQSVSGERIGRYAYGQPQFYLLSPHELYRRVLCNYFGELIERGEYFSSEEELGKVIQNICYYNVETFLNLINYDKGGDIMLQQVMTKPGEIIFREVEIPEVKDDQVLVKIMNIGICGSDIHVYHGKHPFTKYPVTQGMKCPEKS